MSVSFSVLFLLDPRGSCGSLASPPVSGGLSLQMSAGTQFWAHGATWLLPLQYKGRGGALLNFLTPGKLKVTL